MENILIRKAVQTDLPKLLDFEQGVISTERPFDPTLKTEPTRYYDIELMLAADHIELVVAECDEQLIGSGYARIEEAKPYLQHRQHAYLGFMYVVPQFRGKGVNKMIMDRLADWAAARNIRELRLDVYQQNEPAIHAYERTGFVKHMLAMRKGL